MEAPHVRGARGREFSLIAVGLLFFLLCSACIAQEQAGVTAAVRGRVELASRAGEVGRLVRSGEPIYLGNAIKSGPDSGLQVMLLDQTTFTIGPDSEMTIDEFIYDPARGGAGKVTASIAKGVFRFVTGKVAQNDPASMKVRLPAGVIDVRGTIAIGSVVRPDPQSLVGLKQQVVLVGPGSNADSKDRVGAILLSASNSSVIINRPGFGSQLAAGGGTWDAPVRFTPETITALQARLSPLPPPGAGAQQMSGKAGQATNTAGAGATQARAEVAQVERLEATTLAASAVNSEANSQQIRDATITPPVRGQAPGPPTVPGANLGLPDGTTTFGQLRLASGTYNFTQIGVPVSDGSGGTYNLFLNVDAGARQFAAAGSRLEINTSSVSGVAVPTPIDFTLTPANQSVSLSFGSPGNSNGDFVGSACGTSMTCSAQLQVTAQNAGGTAAAKLLQQLSVFNDQGGQLFGGSSVIPQLPGLVTDPAPILNGTSTFDQLRSVNSGQFYYNQSNVPLGGNDSYSLFANIDFGSRTFGGGNSRVAISGTNINFAFGLNALGYGGNIGPAVFQYAVNTGLLNVTVTASPQNVNNTVSLQLSHSVQAQFQAGLGVVVTLNGSGTTANRTPGMAPP